ncbi:MAG: acyl-CoA dehydrogenase family protein, partial [Paracoccaceae bacterium]
QAEVAYQNAVAYAKDRLQGRDVTGVKNPDGPADPLIVHPDIRRNLMDQKSFVEGARAFTFWGASLIDQAHREGDADANGLISLLTPVIKGFLTDKGYEYASAAQQVYGGHGYIEEWGIINCNGFDAHFAGCLNHAAGDFATVSNQNFIEHVSVPFLFGLEGVWEIGFD